MYMLHNMMSNQVFAGWSIEEILKKSTDVFTRWGGYALTALGVILVIVSVVNIVKYFMSQGRSQNSILLPIVGLFIGGALAATGIKLFLEIGKGGKESIEQFGNTILYLRSMF